MYLLAISRKLFTHSVPLVVAEQCYEKLLEEVRNLIINSKVELKKEKAYQLMINLIEEYNIRLLSTKIYWENPQDREEYKKFWDEYKNIDKESEEGKTKKEILFMKKEIEKLGQNDKNNKIIRFYKNKLIEYGVLREFRNSCRTEKGHYIKKAVRV